MPAAAKNCHSAANNLAAGFDFAGGEVDEWTWIDAAVIPGRAYGVREPGIRNN